MDNFDFSEAIKQTGIRTFIIDNEDDVLNLPPFNELFPYATYGYVEKD